MAVEVVDLLEMVEIDQNEGAFAALTGGQALKLAQQRAAIAKACGVVGEGVFKRFLFRHLERRECLIEIAGTAPSKQDDRNVEKECDGERWLPDSGQADCTGQHLRADHHEKD